MPDDSGCEGFGRVEAFQETAVWVKRVFEQVLFIIRRLTLCRRRSKQSGVMQPIAESARAKPRFSPSS